MRRPETASAGSATGARWRALRHRLSPAAWVSLGYLCAGVAWILLSDRLGAALFKDASALTSFQTYKGWLFVSVTALLLYASIRRARVAFPSAARDTERRGGYSVQWLLTLLVLATAVPLLLLLAYNVKREADIEVGKANLLVRDLAAGAAVNAATTLAELERMLALLSYSPAIQALDPDRCGSSVTDALRLYRGLADVATSNLQGDVICSVLHRADGSRPNIGNSAWFKDLRRSGGFVVGAPQKDRFTGRWSLVVSYPLRNQAGEMTGSVGAVIDLAAFEAAVTGALPGGAVVGLSDRDENVIARSFRADEMVGRNLRGLALSRTIRSQREGTVTDIGADGVQRLYAFTPVGASGWFAVAGVPTESLYAAGRRAVWRTALFGIGMLLLLSLLVLLIHRRIARPMSALAATAARIAGGEFDARAPLGGPPEVAQVARGINQAIDRMRESEARFRALTTLASDWYWETDDEHRFTTMSYGNRDGQISDAERAHYIGRARWDIEGIDMPADEVQRYRDMVGRREAFRNFEMTLRDFKGRAHYALVSGEPVFDAADRFTGYRGVAHSITARRLAEDALRRSEQHYRALFDASPDAMLVICEDRIVRLNPAGMRLFGVDSPTGLVGKPVAETVHPESREVVMQRVRTVIEERLPVPPLEEKLVTAAGSVIYIEATSIPVEYEGKPAALSIVHDISGRKAAERTLRQLNAGLEEQVRRRTAELSETHRSLEAFSYTVAHDLRAPLRSISGFAALLEEDAGAALDDEGREFLGRIKHSAASMSQLIEGLLDLSRLGHAPLHLQAVDLGALALAALQDLRRRHPERHVDVVIEPGMCATGDPVLLKDVLDNLIGNAWKFSAGRDPAHITVGSAAAVQAGPGSRAYFVRDDGAGFDPAYADKLFGTFQRLHTAEEFAGIGIGLASVKRIIDKHGGAVWAEGAVGLGATFWFSLPEPAA